MKEVAHVLPGWLEPVLAFANSVDMETGTDELAAGPPALAGWLTARGLLAPDPAVTVSRADFRIAVDLRAGLRAMALRNNGGPADDVSAARLRRSLDLLPLVADEPLDGDGPALRPHRLTVVRSALGQLVAGYVHSVGTGDWGRLKRCPADDCAWAFWDSSAKGARRWCNMRVCGNRAKVRAFARRRAGQPA